MTGSTPDDETLRAQAEKWHDDETLGDDQCEHRTLEAQAYMAGFRAAAQLVAASPAAAAGVPTGWKLVPREPTPLMVQVAREAESMMLSGPDIYRAMVLASPVAPVGAPTLSDEQIIDRACDAMIDAKSPDLPPKWCLDNHARLISFARALLSRQGCELAADATKQLREHSVHPAVNDAGQDFRMRPASSEAAPSAEPSGHSYGENCRRCEGGYCLAFPNWSKKV